MSHTPFDQIAGGRLQRVAAFTTDPAGGNPAGVWVGDALPPVETMQRIAANVGFSETVFISPAAGATRTVRYYSPQAEVPFCGHATIAAGVMLGESDGGGTYVFETIVGAVPVAVREQGGVRTASLTSVTPKQAAVPDVLLQTALATIGWTPDDLDPAIAPVLAYAGAWHLVLAARTAERLATLTYDMATLGAIMREANLTTLQLIHRRSSTEFTARNPFPVGGVFEDPATGAAAAALGGYLRDAGYLQAPARFEIRQGEAMGRPSVITVEVPATGGIVVTGAAVGMGAG